MDESWFKYPRKAEQRMEWNEFAQRADRAKGKLYKTALLYLGDESAAEEALDETIYKGLRACGKLREPEYFDTWITRILINVCCDERKRKRRVLSMEALDEAAAEDYDALPLREAVRRLPRELREVVILRYFSGDTLRETAEILNIPQGTVVTRQRRALSLLRLELEEEETE